jgi:KUP system potassium uptake protein
MTARPEGAPPILVHHITHNKVLHEQVILLTVQTVDVPTVDPAEGIAVERLANGFWRVVAKFGFMDQPNVPSALERAREMGLSWRVEDTTYYLAHLTLFTHAASRLGMMAWRDKLFVFLSRNARRATNFFQIPPDRVVEIGIQLEI